MMEKEINGIAVELVVNTGCRGCIFATVRKGVKHCETSDNSCLGVPNGGWRKVEKNDGIVNEDPLY